MDTSHPCNIHVGWSTKECRIKMRITIIRPPFYLLTGPAAAPAVLAGFLREHGHEAISFDVNQYCIDHLLHPSAINNALIHVDHFDSRYLGAHAKTVLPTSILHAVEDLRYSSTYASPILYRTAQRDIETALSLHASVHRNTLWTTDTYTINHIDTDPQCLFDTVETGGELFDGAIDEALIALREYAPDVVAISICVPQQLYGALRIAYRLKIILPLCHITLGGATITRLRRAVQQLPRIFDFVDTVILREGELPLVALLGALSQGLDPLNYVQGVLARRGTIVAESSRHSEASLHAFDIRTLPPPVFEDIYQGRYLSPQLLLPISTTRNCYYDKCDFCAISRSFNHGYREMTPAQICNIMENLSTQYDQPIFKDVSEALPPRLVFALSDELAKRDRYFDWEAYLRFEKAFDDKATAKKLRKAGLRVAYLGLETGSQALSDRMHKHNNLTVAENTIRLFANEGIWVHLFLMSGHPGETESDHEATLSFLRRNRDYVHSIRAAPFGLEIDSNLAHIGQKYGIKTENHESISLSVRLAASTLGEVPDNVTVSRRLDEIRHVAYEESKGTLRGARYVWDGHRIMFAVHAGGPHVPTME